MLVFFVLALPLVSWARRRLAELRQEHERRRQLPSGEDADSRHATPGTLLWRSPEYVFLAMSLCSGILCAFLLPAYASSSWDGFTHFDYANAISYVVDAQYTGADALMASSNAFVWSQAIEGQNVFPTKNDAAAREVVYDTLEDAEENDALVVCEGTSAFTGDTGFPPLTWETSPMPWGFGWAGCCTWGLTVATSWAALRVCCSTR